jgi:formate hydrogenlyase transcriptional activator
VGSSRTKRVDVRIVAATNQDLEAAVRDGRFRVDLYYRLSVFPIVLPPLRDRPEDIPPLVWFFVTRLQRRLGRHIERVPQASMDALQRAEWPGNVRELQNVVERAMIRSTGEVLQIEESLGSVRRVQKHRAADRTLATAERAHIIAVLDECGWRINGPGGTAEKLALNPNTLRFRMKKLAISRPPGPKGHR